MSRRETDNFSIQHLTGHRATRNRHSPFEISRNRVRLWQNRIDIAGSVEAMCNKWAPKLDPTTKINGEPQVSKLVWSVGCVNTKQPPRSPIASRVINYVNGVKRAS